jgi:hypothetical protein
MVMMVMMRMVMMVELNTDIDDNSTNDNVGDDGVHYGGGNEYWLEHIDCGAPYPVYQPQNL